MSQLLGLVGLPARGEYDGTDVDLRGTCAVLKLYDELAGLPGGLRDRGRLVDRDVRIRLDLLGELLPAGILEVLVRRALREHLAEPGGPAAQAVFLLDQRHLVPGRCGGPRSRHAADAPTDDHQVLAGFLDEGLRRPDGPEAGYAHADLIFTQHLGVFVVRRMTPGDLFTQVRPVGQHMRREFERRGEDALRTRRYHDAVDPLVLDIRLDRFDTFPAAKDVVRLAESSLRIIVGDLD